MIKQAAPGGWSIYASQKIGSSGKLIAVDLLPLQPSVARQIMDHNILFRSCEGDFTNLGVKEWIVDVIHQSKLNDVSLQEKDFIGENIDNPYALKASETLFQIRNLLKELDMTKEAKQKLTINLFQMIHCQADIIMSDMAANFTGDKSTDALRTLALCEEALFFAIGSSCLDVHSNKKDFSRSALIDILKADISPFHEKLLPSWQQLGLLRMKGSFLCKFFSCGEEDEGDLKDFLSQNFDRVDLLKPPASRKESAEQYLLASGFHGNPLWTQLFSSLQNPPGEIMQKKY